MLQTAPPNTFFELRCERSRSEGLTIPADRDRSEGEVSVPGLPQRRIVAKVYGAGAEVLEPNWLARPACPLPRLAHAIFLRAFSTSFGLCCRGDARPNLSLTNFGNTMQRWRVMTCGEGMSYVGFSRTSSNIVRVRSCGLAISRRRCRACDGFRSSIRSLVGQGSREKAARRPGERPCRSDAWRSCAGSGELAPEVDHARVL